MKEHKNSLYWYVRSLLSVIFRIFLGVKVHGQKWFPKNGRVILAVNHVSGYDPFIVGTFSPRELHFLAKEELFRFPPLGKLLKKLNAIPLQREGGDRRAIQTAFHILKAEHPLLLFPEGTRSRNGKFQKAKAGVGMLAWRSGSNVLPVHLSGTFRLFPNLLRRRIRVTFGRPIEIERFKSLRLPLKEIYLRISEEAMIRIKELEHAYHH